MLFAVPRSRAQQRRRPRGTAEIELLFSCMVIITLILLVAAGLRIGAARLSTANSATWKVFHDATSANPQQYVGSDPAPIDGFESVRPGFPKRVHDTHDTQSLTNSNGNNGQFSTQVGAKATLISPAWTYSGYPTFADQNYNQSWMQDYVDESHANLNNPLGLAPAWPP